MSDIALKLSTEKEKKEECNKEERETEQRSFGSFEHDRYLQVRVWCSRLKLWFPRASIPDQVLSFRDCILSFLIVEIFVPLVFS